MVVRIIEEKPDPSVVRQVVCQECGVKLEFTKGDVTTRKYRDISQVECSYCWITCPKCHKEVNVTNYYYKG